MAPVVLFKAKKKARKRDGWLRDASDNLLKSSRKGARELKLFRF